VRLVEVEIEQDEIEIAVLHLHDGLLEGEDRMGFDAPEGLRGVPLKMLAKGDAQDLMIIHYQYLHRTPRSINLDGFAYISG
jgi:hypothetical protein